MDFEAIRKQKKRKIEPLPSIDHSTVRYPPFNKVFYDEHEQIKELPNEKVKSLRFFIFLMKILSFLKKKKKGGNGN